jgi:UDP-glucuronate 4-epimerase
VDALLARQDRVIAVDSFNDYYSPALKRRNLCDAMANSNFELHEVDICDGPEVFRIFQAACPDVVVHLAARAGVRPSLLDPNLYHRVNVIGTQNILDACRSVGCTHIVFASSSSVYGGITEVPFRETMDISRPISPYAATKRMNELMGHVYSHVYGMSISMLRFFTVYGPRQRPDMAISMFVDCIEKGKPIQMFGDGSTRRDYTYIEDIIDGVVKAIDKPFQFEIFNLGESQTISLRELISIIEEKVGKKANIERNPMQPGDVEVTYAHIEKAKQLLGYAPRFGLEEGISRYIHWYRSQNQHVE